MMSGVNLSTELPVSPEQIWELIGGFHALGAWHPAIETSELEGGGRIRRLKLVGGGEIVEKLERFDDQAHTYTYSIVESPLPVANYTSTLRVTPSADGNGAKLEWSGAFDPAGLSENEAVAAVRGVYEAGFENLRKLISLAKR